MFNSKALSCPPPRRGRGVEGVLGVCKPKHPIE